MTEYQLEDEKSQESLVDGRGMWHRLDKQPDDSKPARSYTLLLRHIRSDSFLCGVPGCSESDKSTSEAIRCPRGT